VADAEYLIRAIPTYDEVSFGLPRLSDANLVVVSFADDGGIEMAATPLAQSLVVPGQGDGTVLDLQKALGCRPYPEPEVEDRSRGRLPGLDPRDMEAVVAASQSWRSRIPPHVWARFWALGAEPHAGFGPQAPKERRKEEPPRRSK